MFEQARRTGVAMAIWLALAATLGGCAFSGKNFEDPTVALTDVEVERARLLEQRFVLHFRIDNPNDMSLAIRGLVYDVTLDGIPLAVGESNKHFVIPARAQTDFEIPVRTNLWRHLKNVIKTIKDPERPIPYRLSGEVKTGGVFFGRNVHLFRIGEIIPSRFLEE